ncbi:MAG: hypothetical protein ACRDTE_05755 [Pseudonocardiaceae bacterium]
MVAIGASLSSYYTQPIADVLDWLDTIVLHCPQHAGGLQLNCGAELSCLHGMEPDTYEAAMARRTGLGRLVQPDEVAQIVQWLAIHSGPAISGQTLKICGTLTMG